MKKKGRSGTAGGGIAGATAWRHVAADKMGAAERALAGGEWWEKREWKDEGRRRARTERGYGRGRGLDEDSRASNVGTPSSSLLLLNFIFTACEKFHKAQFHFPFPPHPGISFCGGPVSSPPPLQSLCPHNVFLLSLEK